MTYNVFGGTLNLTQSIQSMLGFPQLENIDRLKATAYHCCTTLSYSQVYVNRPVATISTFDLNSEYDMLTS